MQDTGYGYTGQMKEGDIYFYNARWYDPQLGRFMQADTFVPTVQGTQGFDRYAYVNNSPMRYTDPSGHRISNTNLLMHDGGGFGRNNIQTVEDPIDYILYRMKNDFRSFLELENSLFMGTSNRYVSRPAYEGLAGYHLFITAKFIVGSRPGGPYDLKPSLTQRYFQGIRDDDKKYISAGNIEVKFDTFGNTYYGYVGSMLGLPEPILLQGAGLAR